MEKAISIIAVIISFFALLFGGLLNSSWNREVNVEDVTVSVNSVSYGIRKIADRPIDVPSDLVARTIAARFFPSLKPSMTREELEEILASTKYANLGEASTELALANSELIQGDISEGRARSIWSDISPESKTTLFAMKTARQVKEKIREALIDIDEDTLSTLFNDLGKVESGISNVSGVPLLQRPEVRAVILEVIAD